MAVPVHDRAVGGSIPQGGSLEIGSQQSQSQLPNGGCNFRELSSGARAPVCGCKRFWLNGSSIGPQDKKDFCFRTPCLLSSLGKPAVASTFGCCERSASRGRPTYARPQHARRLLCGAPGRRRSITKAQRRPGHTRRFSIPIEVNQHSSLGCIERIRTRPRRWRGIHYNLQTSIDCSPQYQWGCYPTISTEANGPSTQHSFFVARKSWIRR